MCRQIYRDAKLHKHKLQMLGRKVKSKDRLLCKPDSTQLWCQPVKLSKEAKISAFEKVQLAVLGSHSISIPHRHWTQHTTTKAGPRFLSSQMFLHQRLCEIFTDSEHFSIYSYWFTVLGGSLRFARQWMPWSRCSSMPQRHYRSMSFQRCRRPPKTRTRICRNTSKLGKPRPEQLESMFVH